MSPNLFDELLSKLTPAKVSQIGSQAGASPQQASETVAAAVPMLVGALANNAARPGGAEALSQAIDQGGHGNEDLETMLERLITGAASTTGNKMLNHILGERRAPIEQTLAAKTGASPESVDQILKTLGPLVMGAVGKAKQSQSLAPADLARFLGQQKAAGKGKSGDLGSQLFDLLDANDDGNVADDLMRLARQVVGKR